MNSFDGMRGERQGGGKNKKEKEEKEKERKKLIFEIPIKVRSPGDLP